VKSSPQINSNRGNAKPSENIVLTNTSSPSYDKRDKKKCC